MGMRQSLGTVTSACKFAKGPWILIYNYECLNPYCKLLVQQVQTHKHLGITFSNDLRWNAHLNHICSKAYKRINVLRKLKFTLDRNTLETIYTTFIRPLLEYGDVLFDNCTRQEKDDLEKIQHEAARIVTGATCLVSITKLMDEVGWESLETRRSKHKLIQFYRMTNGILILTFPL